MNAAIDLGNTFGKLALFEEEELVDFERGIRLESLVKKLKKVKPKHTIICSVTKSLTELEELFAELPNVLILNQSTPIPIVNDYGTPATLGYDRLAAAAEAHFLFPKENCLILDLGTAIKYDFITQNGVFKGGIISPGMQMRFKALHTFTKKLPLVNAEGIPALVGNSTTSCMQSGVVNGISAEINGLIARYREQGKLKIIISGGDAEFFESQINYPTFAASNLVLKGLNRILTHNVENKNFT